MDGTVPGPVQDSEAILLISIITVASETAALTIIPTIRVIPEQAVTGQLRSRSSRVTIPTTETGIIPRIFPSHPEMTTMEDSVLQDPEIQEVASGPEAVAEASIPGTQEVHVPVAAVVSEDNI